MIYWFTQSYTLNVTFNVTLPRCIREHSLYAKAEKCEFHKPEIAFLSYCIGPEGLSMGSNKVSVVTDWAEPTTTKELQCFLGFMNFYRRLIRNFSTIAAPMTNMLKGEKWGGITIHHGSMHRLCKTESEISQRANS